MSFLRAFDPMPNGYDRHEDERPAHHPDCDCACHTDDARPCAVCLPQMEADRTWPPRTITGEAKWDRRIDRALAIAALVCLGWVIGILQAATWR